MLQSVSPGATTSYRLKMKGIFVLKKLITAFVMVLWPVLLPTTSADERPNIILIMVDDLGFADLGCYGSEIKTPRLDTLAANGLRFTQLYNTAKCHSSRVSLLTGLYCDQAGSTMLSRGATIAEVLSGAGYFTAMVGKWHLGKQPTDFGFHRYWGHLSGVTNYFTGDNTFRLKGRALAPVGETLTPLSFRKDTRSGSVAKKKK
jgi:arylsulfatase A-like enzyme